jgi:hypothetical protein
MVKAAMVMKSSCYGEQRIVITDIGVGGSRNPEAAT